MKYEFHPVALQEYAEAVQSRLEGFYEYRRFN